MPTIFVQPIELDIEIKKGETIKEALGRAGVHIETPCAGNGICGDCRIWAKEPDKIPPTPHENISPDEEAKGLRLACMAIPTADTLIELDANYLYNKDDSRYGKQKQNHLKILSSAITSSKTVLSPTVASMKYSSNPKALAIDIGTTTLVVSLVSLITGKILASASSINPQAVFGHDVLSRIEYASTSKGLLEMSDLIRNKLNELVEQACKESNSQVDEIVDVAIGANTTMLQIAAAIDPAPLGHLPFKIDISGGTNYPASQFGLHVNPSAQVYLPPVMHAFVGSDISAGLLASPEFFQDNNSVLYLDMGTNGEICLNVKGQRLTTSTAAGPAFEGMGISSGMRATDGALERVYVKDGQLILQVIGEILNQNDTESRFSEGSLTTKNGVNSKNSIKGVCGSGIVDLVAAILTTGHLDRSGKLKFIEEDSCLVEESKSHLLEDKLLKSNKNEQFKVVKKNSQPAFCYGKNLYLTQKDIRQIQLAKGAIRTGVDLILRKGGITCKDLDKIYIAGGFGNFLNPGNMEIIGLLPQYSADKVVFCGNACIDGTIMLLTNASTRTFLENALHNMEHLQLADSPEFMECFVENLNF